MGFKYWQCTNCGNCYATKVDRCELAGKMTRHGFEFGCGCERYPIAERSVESVRHSDKGWDTFEGLYVQVNTYGEPDYEILTFKGQSAFDRQDKVFSLLQSLVAT